MSNTNNRLFGTLYLGFPKSMPIGQVQEVYDEIADYIDNNSDLTLENLQNDKDYGYLVLTQEPPTEELRDTFHYMEMQILISPFSYTANPNTSTLAINIHAADFEDLCELMMNHGYRYEDNEDCWQKVD